MPVNRRSPSIKDNAHHSRDLRARRDYQSVRAPKESPRVAVEVGIDQWLLRAEPGIDGGFEVKVTLPTKRLDPAADTRVVDH
jgi:hypothetical protein